MIEEVPFILRPPVMIVLLLICIGIAVVFLNR